LQLQRLGLKQQRSNEELHKAHQLDAQLMGQLLRA
jgi:hypothetical protein